MPLHCTILHTYICTYVLLYILQFIVFERGNLNRQGGPISAKELAFGGNQLFGCCFVSGEPTLGGGGPN